MANEKRLIDANFIKAVIQNYIANNEVTEAFVEIAGHICGMLDDCETVDAVEVVRCRDCKCWIHMEDGFGDCTNGRFHLDGHADPTMKADDFCSCGERREGE